MNTVLLLDWVNKFWDEKILKTLKEYIAIPAKSKAFDAQWRSNGHVHKVVELAENWCRAHAPKHVSVEVIDIDGRTPILLLEIPGDSDATVLMYGHLDKQPEMVGWDAERGLGPWTPKIIVDDKGDERLYGRGGADDGYSVFASLTAVLALQKQNISHARCVILIETGEESGSPDLPFYLDHLSDRIGEPDLVICLDSGAGNYDQLWLTSSLRGLVIGTLRVDVLEEGVHSGDASGIVESSFRIIRSALDRIESTNGCVFEKHMSDFLCVDIPEERREQAQDAAQTIGHALYERFQWAHNSPDIESDELTDLVLARTWGPAMSVTGVGGIPAIKDAGNVLRPFTELKLSIRIPPTLDPEVAYREVKFMLENHELIHAKVTFTGTARPGWHAPTLASWLESSIQGASMAFFEEKALYMGEGGTIPFMKMLHDKFPQSQFVITGVLGPGANAHGPNEFLHIPYAKKLTACIAKVLRDHYIHIADDV